MSASRDQNQKITFLYSNLYQLYRKGKEAAKKAPDHSFPRPFSLDEDVARMRAAAEKAGPSSRVLKTENLKAPTAVAAAPVATATAPTTIREYRPAELLGKRVAPPASAANLKVQENALESLKQNLKSLNDLHSRLRFMLQELEELVQE